MGVYIKGMEMPPDGRYTLCITHDSDGGVHWVIQNQDTIEFLKHGAVTEIHEPHGRLGDLDDIIKRAKKWIDHPDKYISQRNKDMIYILEREDAIIPAEEGE